MSSAPLPTRLVFLNDLSTLAPGEKVRFLGCVTEYNISTGTLTLQHAYPSSSGNGCFTANVDVNLLLSTLKSTDTQVGEWVNVMGYVQAPQEKGKSRDGNGLRGGNVGGKSVKVQAVMLWSAGAIKLVEYEKAVEMRKSTTSYSYDAGS